MRLLFLLALIELATAQNPATWRSEASALKSKGDVAGALAAFEKAANAEPFAADLQDEIGFLLAAQARHPDALARFEKAIALDAKYAPARYHLAIAAWLLHDPSRAIPAAQEAVRLVPGSA